jgi:hypothetical protein
MLQDDDRNLQFLNHAIDIKTNVLPQALHQWGNDYSARLECGRSWVRAPIKSNQRL